jgi:hypothetical protein
MSSSTIAGQTLFDSGPERFVVRSVGTLFLPPLALDALQITTTPLTALEVWIIQTGRLTAPTDTALWDQVELIRQRAEAQLTGTLVLPTGRQFMDMTLLRLAPESPVEHGRVVSLGYRADYIRLG